MSYYYHLEENEIQKIKINGKWGKNNGIYVLQVSEEWQFCKEIIKLLECR